MKHSILFLVLFLAYNLQAQEKSKAKFGNVTAADFAAKLYPIDSNAHAVVIADIGSSDIEGNTKGWFSLIYKHYKRVHILNKNGYDIANVSIPLYTDGSDEEELDKIKAVTYNLEGGKVIETKLDAKGSIFKDKINKNLIIKKFTFPNVKEGSIIEFEYTVKSDFLRNLQPWEFQGTYPRLWSEYNLRLPYFFNYVFLMQGYLPYAVNDRKTGSMSYNILASEGTGASERYTIQSSITDYRWVIKEAPAMKEESYTSTIDNYISKIEFQLSEYRQPLIYKRIMGTWPSLSEDLMKSEYFGEALSKNNGWLKDVVKPLIDGANNNNQKARNIYSWVRDNITTTSSGGVHLDQSLKNVIKTRNGSVPEVNLLLAAMLRYADIAADPVILSTKSHGFIYPLYPLLTRFNYVVCRATVEGKQFFLDATEPRLAFGSLPLKCYNGPARVIDDVCSAIILNPDSLNERSMTTVFIINNEKGKMIGSLQHSPGLYQSLSIRNKINEKGADDYFKEIKKNFGSAIEMSNTKIDSLEKNDETLAISFDFDIEDEKEELIYFNPMFSEGFKDNPFKSAERRYPVEMPYAVDDTYNLQLEVPVGYEVDELPKQLIVKLNEEGDGMFEYRINHSASTISLRSRLMIKRTLFSPEEYDMLREFFSLVVKKHNEQIVFKKKK